MKNKLISIGLWFFTSLAVSTLYGQVTVGGTTVPEDYSVLQVEGESGGVRLPRMTTEQRTDLENSLKGNGQSAGLVIYNISTNNIEFWDGQAWHSLSDANLTANNGISKTGDILQLGGGMTETSTSITQNENTEFDINIGSTGKFNINSKQFAVKGNDIGFAPTTSFSLNNTLLNATSKKVEMTIDKLNINNEVLTMGEDAIDNKKKISVNGVLNYQDGNQSTGYLLARIGNSNVARWEPLRPLGSIVTGQLNDDIAFGEANKPDPSITIKSLVLPPGKWMIFAKYAASLTVPTGTMVYHWIHLKSKTAASSTWTTEYTTGMSPEVKTAGQIAYSTPNLMHVMDIYEETEFQMFAGSENHQSGNRTVTTSFTGGSHFFAIRIDVPGEIVVVP